MDNEVYATICSSVCVCDYMFKCVCVCDYMFNMFKCV